MMKQIVFFLALFLPIWLGAQSVRIDLNKKYQQMEGFGASDCWTVQYVGKYWSLHEKEKAAKYLFSSALDAQGNPEGIGLTIWRFNVGGGTMEQGDASDLKTDITRRAECFMDAKGKYDWNKQIGQQWFLQKAAEYGCSSFVAFSNTPPVYYTRNGKGYALKDGNSNLSPDKYRDFARFLVKVANHFEKKKGIHFEYISPVNEPQWDWTASYQEGCPWQNDEIRKLAIELDKEITRKKLNSKILLTEAGSWDNLYKVKKRASNQIYTFFDKESPDYIGSLKSLPPVIGGHSYWTDSNHTQIKEERDNVKKAADKYGLKVLQTEWSMLSKPPLEGFPKSYAEASYMDIALFMSKIIHADIVYAGVSSWSFWTSMDIELWGFKNRFNLLRLHTPKNDVNSIVDGGKVSAVKTLWALGNFSRFVRPGYVRIATEGADDMSLLMATSYLSPDGKEMVSVYINMNDEPTNVNVELTNASRLKNCASYITDKLSDLSYQSLSVEGSKYLSLSPKSVTTVIYSFE